MSREIEKAKIQDEIEAEQNEQQQQAFQYLIEDKWQHRKKDVELFHTLLESRSNIFLHGSNGCGKTTFVADCFKSKKFDLPAIHIDAIQLYSEKLIAIYISQHLHGILQNKATQLKLPNKIAARKF